MKNYLKRSLFILPVAMVLAAVPSSVQASCTEGYMLCLNEAAGAWDDWGAAHFDIVDDLAYLECGAGWAGCVRAKLLGF
jgi:hypothetical protein